MTDEPNLPIDGETALAAPIGEEFVLVLGVADAMPQTLQVLLNGDPAMCMEATVVSWRRPGAPADIAVGFVAAIPLQIAGRLRLGSVVMRRAGRPVRFTLMRRALPLPGLLHLMAADAGDAFADAVDGLIQALMAGRGSPRRLAAALTMLQVAARNDGFVEVMGALDTGEVYLQGWSTELPADGTRLLVSHEGFLVGDFVAATVPREDLGDNGRGFVGLLDPGKVPVAPEAFERLFFRGAHGWRSLEIYERRVLLASTDVPAHIRDVLPRAEASPETLLRLRRAAQRFDGRDTVSPLQKPIRLGMDLAAEVPGGGMLVSGWMLDPEGLVDSIALRCGTAAETIGGSWTRLPRPDVTHAFQNDPLFAGRIDPTRHDHGFLAFVPGVSASDDCPAYFELTIDADTIAFYPLTVARGLSRQALERLMSALDPHTATASLAIERHIGPMLQAMQRPAPRIVEIRDFGFDEAAPLALVVGAAGEAEEAAVALSLLALDPETRNVPIVLSVPVGHADRVGADAQRLAGFYGLGLRLVIGEGIEDMCDAFEAAVGATGAETLAFLSASVLPREAGWLSRMERAYRARGGKVLVSPTIVFEDDSIRFAGTWLETDGGERRLSDRYIGYPRDVVRNAEPSDVVAGTVACCLLPRAAIEAVGGFNRSYLGPTEKGRDLCLQLKLAGTPSVWLPEVEMIAAEENAGTIATPWQKLAQRADRWSFNRRWTLLVANMRG